MLCSILMVRKCAHTHARTSSTAILQPYDEPNVSKLKTNKKHRNSQGRSQDFYSEKIPLPPPSPPLPSLPSFSPTSSSPSPFSLPPTLPSPLSPPFPQLLGDMGERCKLKTKKNTNSKGHSQDFIRKGYLSLPPPLPFRFLPSPPSPLRLLPPPHSLGPDRDGRQTIFGEFRA